MRCFTGKFFRPSGNTRRLGRRCGSTRFNPIMLLTYKRHQGWFRVGVACRVLKCDVTTICIFEIIGFSKVSAESVMKNAYLPKIIILLQFGSEKLALLCSDESIQILLILS